MITVRPAVCHTPTAGRTVNGTSLTSMAKKKKKKVVIKTAIGIAGPVLDLRIEPELASRIGARSGAELTTRTANTKNERIHSNQTRAKSRAYLIIKKNYS
ncbi:hypothetical protein EVAR_11468_1 [Eumeta japonica]|uniref:Uncharacterized protein n=1 Tax=Eumeta variegata TaxID=151549 RepID=A0A4C1TM76_EUMVA|nr:hypothetical protein EVAR_11468_1 [Eumeta japonica]